MNRTNATTKKLNTTDVSRMQAFLEQRQSTRTRILEAVLCAIHHFFGDLNSLFSGICDPHNPQKPNKTTHSIAGLAFTAVMMDLCHLEAKRQIRLLVHNNAGSNRWKIESQGFNAQENGGYGLERANIADPNSTKVLFHYLMQTAHTIALLSRREAFLEKMRISDRASTGRLLLGASGTRNALFC